MILRKFIFHMETSQSVLHLGTSFIILKVSKKNPRRKTGAVWTEERREKRKVRMRKTWRERKKE